MHKLILCMQKVALQAGRLEDSGDVAWRDLERLLQIAEARQISLFSMAYRALSPWILGLGTQANGCGKGTCGLS